MNIFDNDNQFGSEILDNSWEESFDHEYDSIINTDVVSFNSESYFQDNSYEQSFDHQSYFQDTSYESSLDHQSYFQDTEPVDYTVSPIDDTLLYPQQNSIFTDGLKGIEIIADKQQGNTCGLESIENIVQLYNPNLGNDFSADIQKGNEHYFNVDGSLKVEHYKDILESKGISSTWNEFDHQQIVNALSEHRPVVVIADAHDIAPEEYASSGDNAWHAITLTQVVYDNNGNILGYRGIDSNFPGQEKYWQADVLETASKEWQDEAQQLSVLIPDQQALAWGNFSQGEQIA